MTVNLGHALCLLSAVQLVCLPCSFAQSQTQWTLTFPNGPALLDLRLVDWNVDSRPDVVISTGSGINVYDGANGALQWNLIPSSPGVGWSGAGPLGLREVSFGRLGPPDTDADGLPDFLFNFSLQSITASTISYSNTVQLFDIGTKTLKWQRQGLVSPNPISFSAITPFGGPMAVGNVDGDPQSEVVLATGTYDFIAGRYNNCAITILDGDTGNIQTNISAGSLSTFFSGLRLIDWDYDGVLDVFYALGDQCGVFSGSGAPKWVLPLALPDSTWRLFDVYGFKEVTAGRFAPLDFDADGNPDLLVATKPAGVSASDALIQLYDVASKQLHWQSRVAYATTVLPAFDWNLDSDPQAEIVSFVNIQNPTTRQFTNRVVTVLNATNGATQWTRDFGLGSAPVFPSVLDWDDDGVSDVVAQTADNLSVYRGSDGAITWQMSLSQPAPGWMASGPFGGAPRSNRRVTPADIDADGSPDFIMVFSTNSTAGIRIRMYDAVRKIIKWEKSGLTSLVLIPFLDNLDADAPLEIAYATSAFDSTTFSYTNCTVTVLDGVGLQPTIFNLARSGTTFRATINTISGKTYRLQCTDSLPLLPSSDWPQCDMIVGDGSPRILTDSNAAGQQRFYRVRVD